MHGVCMREGQGGRRGRSGRCSCDFTGWINQCHRVRESGMSIFGFPQRAIHDIRSVQYRLIQLFVPFRIVLIPIRPRSVPVWLVPLPILHSSTH